MRICVKYQEEISLFESKGISVVKDNYRDNPIYKVDFGPLSYNIRLSNENIIALYDGIKWINSGGVGGVFIISATEDAEVFNISFDSVSFR